MDTEMLKKRLKSKPEWKVLIDEAIENTSMLAALLEIVQTDSTSVKYACSKLFRRVSEQRPELVYPYFNEIAKWLHHDNSFIKWDGILILSNLAAVDHEHRFEAIFQDYFDLLHDPQMITAANVVGNAWKIVLAKPELENEITRRLLEVSNIIYLNKGEPSPDCNCIVSGQVLECFEHYFEHSKNQPEMNQFAQGQLASCRKSVAKIAEKFIRNHSVNKA